MVAIPEAIEPYYSLATPSVMPPTLASLSSAPRKISLVRWPAKQGNYAGALGLASRSWAKQISFSEDRKLLWRPELESLSSMGVKQAQIWKPVSDLIGS